MSGSAHRGDHDIAFYEATIGFTHELVSSAPTTPEFVNDDDAGPLVPGRYLIQIHDPSSDAVVVWVGTSPFEKGEAPSPVAGPGPDRVPLTPTSVVAVETHVLEGASDRLTVETVGGTATVWATRVSTPTRKGAGR